MPSGKLTKTWLINKRTANIAMSKANAKLLLKVYPLPYYINTNKYRAGWLAEWLKPHWACWRPWVQSSEWQ